MLNTFIVPSGRHWHWYVLCDNHVMDQGVVRSHKTAESKAEASREVISGHLNLEPVS